ncbi:MULTISPECIES: winged helix-turn-helix domain-containing protein [unclassified Sedimentibacter]|uniref:winged helix-turn-helix domain-containing protein n=1 Tax=unclassified Sedimentibacter TaxID=2649220 RepID=UPI0027DF0E87|nr:winged helix-turn-helix domain-containing protein [Sedimentibacter sp. MB35-C1]WMJ76921.1 winged helix-turn-helix domain-containing protein [Sedimentibacter sp. MB35-C1]
MESAAPENLNKIKDNIVIFEISHKDNTYKQISIEEFIEKLKNNEIKIRKKLNIINYASLAINIDSTEVYKDGMKIDLSPREYKMLKLFIDNKGKILTNEQIINCVWGIAYANAGMLRVAIKRLRNKIDPDNEYLKTIRGKGYILIDM